MRAALAAPITTLPVVVNPLKFIESAQDEPVSQLCACGCGEPTLIATKTDKRWGHIKGQPIKFLTGHAGKLQTQLKAGTLTVVQSAELMPGMREITVDDIERIRQMDELDAATLYDQRMRALDKFERRSFAEKGIIALEMEERGYWKRLADPTTGVYFHSYDAWLASAMPFSRSSVYDAKKTIKMLRVVPVADVMEIPRCNAVQMRTLSTSLQKKPEVITAAKTLTGDNFTRFIQDKHPGQHVEARRPIQMKPTESARKNIDIALEAAMWAYEVETREDALEAMGAAWLDAECEKEGSTHLSNRMAHAQAIGGRKKRTA